MTRVGLIARSVLVEAVRRREVYVIVIVSVLLICVITTVDFFHLQGLTKFYREIGLKVMSIATALTTIVLAARQLPREFENRTIYPLMAKPVSRFQFLAGKLWGVMLASGFCLLIFMVVFLCGSFYLKAAVHWALFFQYIYLQMLMMLILATLSFWLSMLFNLDAAITTGILFFATSAVITTATTYIYDYANTFGKLGLRVLTYILPQLTLFDLGAKVVHSERWGPISARAVVELTIYGGFFAVLYWLLAWIWFRRRPL